jgi:hypothetical protein
VPGLLAEPFEHRPPRAQFAHRLHDSVPAVHFFVPMAPPRMLPGFVDAGADFGPNPYAIVGSESANQFAAGPSMHLA